MPRRWRVFPLPYTALVFLIGLAIGAIVNNTPDDAYAQPSFRALESISPTILLTVFLPPLIIPSGLALNWHTAARVLDKSLLLAVPGTLFNCALTAIVAKYILPYNWPWQGCWLLAATLAATDPVAVIAIMESVGASVKLSTVIEGESLLNDGVAFVLFEIFLEWASGEPLSAGGIVAFVFKASLGGPALGIVWAVALSVWLALCFNDAVLEITLSLVAGYTLWIVCDQMLGVSGMLALVFFSSFLGAYGKGRVSRSVSTSFDFFWSWVDWIANTLIFFLVALIIALELSSFQTISGADWGWAIVLWLFLVLIRTVMVILFYPLLRMGTYGLHWKDAVVLAWAGLRGAVGLTLALIVYDSDTVIDQNYREHFFFLTSVMATITLLVQGSTTSLLLKRLGYMHLTPAKQVAMLRAADAVEHLGAVKIKEARAESDATSYLLGDADWNRVRSVVELGVARGVRARPRHRPRFGSKSSATGTALDRQDARSHGMEQHQHGEAIEDVRSRLLQGVSSLYGDAFRTEFLSPGQFTTLGETVDVALDQVHEIKSPLMDWKVLESKLSGKAMLSQGTKSIRAWQRVRHVWRGVGKEAWAERDAALVVAFVCAHAASRRNLTALEGTAKHDNGSGDGTRAPPPTATDSASTCNDDLQLAWSHTELHIQQNSGEAQQSSGAEHAGEEGEGEGDVTVPMPMVSDASALRLVLEESRQEQACAEEYLSFLRKNCPEAVKNLRTRILCEDVLKEEREFLERLLTAKMLEEREVGPVLNTIERRLQMLEFKNVAF